MAAAQIQKGAFSHFPISPSNATSLGKYKIGKAYFGKFGLAFKLYGLNNSSTAFARAVVLHSHPNVLAYEVIPSPIFVSWGCPTVNPAFLKILQNKIDNSSKPILLYIFY